MIMINYLAIALGLAFGVAGASAQETPDSIYDIAAESTDFTTLAAAVDAAGLTDALSGPGTFTVFAPANSAFDDLPPDLLTKLLDPVWQPQLKDVILYHALGSEVRSTDLSDGLVATTMNGEDITINLDPPTINGDTKILVDDGLVDIEASNGIIHGVEAVLVPSSVTSTLVDKAEGGDIFTTLVTVVSAAGLADALSGEGPFTVFAPTNDAFAALPEGTVDFLLRPENSDQLTNLLLYHVVAANSVFGSLSNGDVETLNGDSVMVDISGEDVMVNNAKVTTADIIASNGIIHAIDTVLEPPTEQPTRKPTARPTKPARPKSLEFPFRFVRPRNEP